MSSRTRIVIEEITIHEAEIIMRRKPDYRQWTASEHKCVDQAEFYVWQRAMARRRASVDKQETDGSQDHRLAVSVRS